jgi:hypothetical protein
MLSIGARRGTLVLVLTMSLSGLIRAGGEGFTPLPPAPVAVWEFLDASNQIEHPNPHTDFRAASEFDIDNDGDMDVLIGQNHTSAGVVGTPAPGVLYMNENGRFMDRTAEFFPQFLTPRVTWWTNIHDFDVPGDGWGDIFVPGGNGEPSRLFRNRGVVGGVFLGFEDVSFRITGPLAVNTFSYHAHKADFDNDGAMDMFVYQYRCDLDTPTVKHGQNRILMNRGGILTDETDIRLPIRSEPGIFGHTEDLNNDGWVDISQVNLKNGLVPGPIPQSPAVPFIRVLINDGTGRFPTALEQVMPQSTSGVGTYALEHADLNGDGWLDIFVINWGANGNGNRDVVLVNTRNPAQLFNAMNIHVPEMPNGVVDGDGDHPVARDLNGDGKFEVVVAQFATRPYVLENLTTNGVIRLVERTPTVFPSDSGFRTKLFDVNRDGKSDIWLAMRNRNYLFITPAAEVEPNNTIATASATPGFPAMRVGRLSGPTELESLGGEGEEARRDLDYFGLPARLIDEGGRIRLRPASDTNLKLYALDAAGNVVAVADIGGMGVMEEIVLAAGTAAKTVQVDRQAIGGAGTYRLDFVPVASLQQRPLTAAPAAAAAPTRIGPRRLY